MADAAGGHSDDDRARLAREAYTVADHHRAGQYSRADALDDLAQRCPGFSRREYEAAFAQGMQDSR